MTSYRARFSDGATKEIQNSRREYTHAWRYAGRFKNGTPHANMGFAASKVLAERALATEVKRLESDPATNRSRWLRKDLHPGVCEFREVVVVERKDETP